LRKSFLCEFCWSSADVVGKTLVDVFHADSKQLVKLQLYELDCGHFKIPVSKKS
jgi:hypothetical protein